MPSGQDKDAQTPRRLHGLSRPGRPDELGRDARHLTAPTDDRSAHGGGLFGAVARLVGCARSGPGGLARLFSRSRGETGDGSKADGDRGASEPERSPPIEVDPNASDVEREPMREWRRTAGRTLLTVGAFSVFVNLLMLTMPIYLFQLSDRVLTSHSFETLTMLTVLAIGLIGVLSCLDVLRRQILSRLAAATEAILGGPILAAIVKSAPTGEGGNTQPLHSLHNVRNFIASPTMLLLFDAPLAPLYFSVIFLIHPTLGFLVLAAGLALIIIALINQVATSNIMGRSSAYASFADNQAESLARNAQVINAMGMLNESILSWGKEQSNALVHQVGGQERNVLISGISKFTRLVVQIAILGWGAYLAIQGELTGGTMIAASIIAGRALQPLEGMIEGWRQVTHARAAFKRVETAIGGLRSQEQRLLLPRPRGRMTVDKILYLPVGTREPVLNGVSFELKPGESLAVVGPSGSGKSTLARIMVGCLYPTAGKVRLDTTEMRNWDQRQFGRYTGYLPQEVELFPGTIKENVCRMRTDLTDDEIVEAAKLAGVHDMISHLPNGYETLLDRNGSPLSGGQKQRIALARAFFGDPCFVVLDEPNSNLDAIGEQALADTLKRAKQKGVTTVVITQRPALLNNVDKVLVLRGGRAEAFGPPKDVLHRLVRASANPPAQAKQQASPDRASGE